MYISERGHQVGPHNQAPVGKGPAAAVKVREVISLFAQDISSAEGLGCRALRPLLETTSCVPAGAQELSVGENWIK